MTASSSSLVIPTSQTGCNCGMVGAYHTPECESHIVRAAAKKAAKSHPVFVAYIEKAKWHDYEYRVYSDGREMVSIWEDGDNTGGQGREIPAKVFVEVYGLAYAVKMAQAEYRRQFPEPETLPAGECAKCHPRSCSCHLPNTPRVESQNLKEYWNVCTECRLQFPTWGYPEPTCSPCADRLAREVKPVKQDKPIEFENICGFCNRKFITYGSPDQICPDCLWKYAPPPPSPFQGTRVIFQVAEGHAGGLIARLQEVIALDGLQLYDLEKRNHTRGRSENRVTETRSRFTDGLELVTQGRFLLPRQPGGAFLVGSRTGNEPYRVYCRHTPNHPFSECQCDDYKFYAAGKLAGWCGHVVAAYLAYQASMLLVTTNGRELVGA